MLFLLDQGVTDVEEMGPGKVLSQVVRSDPEKTPQLISVGNPTHGGHGGDGGHGRSRVLEEIAGQRSSQIL